LCIRILDFYTVMTLFTTCSPSSSCMFQCPRNRRDPHSFPTRRSSDLARAGRQVRQRLLRLPERGVDVDVHRLGPLLGGEVLEVLHERLPCRVEHQNVDAAESGDGVPDAPARGPLLAEDGGELRAEARRGAAPPG